MDAWPSHTENKVASGRMESAPQTALLQKATVDMMCVDSKHPSRQAKKGIPSSPQRRNGYGVAVGATLLAFLLRLSLDSYLDDRFAYAPFLVAIAVTTWYGGIGPSLVAVVLGGLIANWVFLHPRYAFGLKDLQYQVGIAVYLTVSLAMVGLAQTWRWAWKNTEERHESCELNGSPLRRAEEFPVVTQRSPSL